MTDSPRPRRRRSDPTVGPQLSRLLRSGVCEPGPVRTHLPGPAGPGSHRAAAAVLPLWLRPVRHRAIRRGSTRRVNRRGAARRPKSPRWLWVVAAVAVLIVVGLVIALVIVNSSKQDTVVAPPPMLEPTTTTTTRTPTTTPRCGRCRRSSRCRRTDTPPSESGDAGRNRDRGLRRQRRRPGHQHHLRRHRRRAADRVQRDAAVEQGSRVAQPGRGFGERQHHQRRPRGDLLDHRQRCAGAAATPAPA